MLLTYCRNEKGEERLYLTPHGSLEAWIAPDGTDGRWAYYSSQAPSDNSPDFDVRKREPSRHYLLNELAALAGVSEAGLSRVPFEVLAQLAVPLTPPHHQRLARRRGRDADAGWRIATLPPR